MGIQVLQYGKDETQQLMAVFFFILFFRVLKSEIRRKEKKHIHDRHLQSPGMGWGKTNSYEVPTRIKWDDWTRSDRPANTN